MFSARKQQNGDCLGPIVAFFRGGRNGAQTEATKWQQIRSHCCFLLWRQEWDQGGSNKMVAAGVSLLLFVLEAGMFSARKQQNGDCLGPIVAFFRGGRNGAQTEATKWQQIRSHCCFLLWRQEWNLGGSSKMPTGGTFIQVVFPLLLPYW